MAENNNLGKPPSFWQRPEGWLGMLTVVGLGVGAVFFLSWLRPFLANALYATIAGGSLLAIAWLALNPRVRNLVSFLFKVVMRKLTGLVIELDPIAIMEGHVEKLEAKLGVMQESIGRLKGQGQHFERLCRDNRAATKEAIALFNEAKRTGKQDQMVLNANKYNRLDRQFKVYVELYKQLEKARVALEKLERLFKFQIDDKRDQIKTAKEEWEATKAARSAIASAKSILAGAGTGELYDQALEYIQRSWDQSLADISNLSDLSEQLISSLDAQDNMRVEQLTAAIGQYEAQFNSSGQAASATLDVQGPDMNKIMALEGQSLDLPEALTMAGSESMPASKPLPKPIKATGSGADDDMSHILDQYKS